jgi:hypothetical protein
VVKGVCVETSVDDSVRENTFFGWKPNDASWRYLTDVFRGDIVLRVTFRESALCELWNGAELIYFLVKRSLGNYWGSFRRVFVIDSCEERHLWACGRVLYILEMHDISVTERKDFD